MEKNNENQEFINYWEYLGIPMNSPMSKIKIAFCLKFMKIEQSLIKVEKKYTPKDLEITTKAFITLSDPYLRYLHNCEIDGEPTPTTEGLLEYLESSEEEIEQDLDNQMEEKFRNWLNYIIDKYSNIEKIFITKLNQSELDILVNIVNELTDVQNKLNKTKNQQRSLNL